MVNVDFTNPLKMFEQMLHSMNGFVVALALLTGIGVGKIGPFQMGLQHRTQGMMHNAISKRGGLYQPYLGILNDKGSKRLWFIILIAQFIAQNQQIGFQFIEEPCGIRIQFDTSSCLPCRRVEMLKIDDRFKQIVNAFSSHRPSLPPYRFVQ